MTATGEFFSWFYTGLGGLGGWFIFFLIAVAAVVWLLYDSASRHLPALGWHTGAILSAALLLPAIVFRFSGAETQASLGQFVEVIFYLGLLGGVVPPVLAVGYFVTNQGMVGCMAGKGHPPYYKSQGRCPECAREEEELKRVVQPPRVVAPPPPPVAPSPRAPRREPETEPETRLPGRGKNREMREKAPGWLITDSGNSHQLYRGETTIGRGRENDIVFSRDESVSRNHAKIIERKGRFFIRDVGSGFGTFINRNRVNGEEQLETNDIIQIGDDTKLKFTGG